jgi:para-aminobenzoate synthetase component 2
MLLMIDNYDSFTYNLVQYFAELGQQVVVRRNDEISLTEIAELAPDFLVISPGPCSPDQAGISMAAIREFAGKIPILGVCLGHQAMAQAFGGKVLRAKQVMHGKNSLIRHAGGSVFQGLNNPLSVTRYHSLVVAKDQLPVAFEITAWTEQADGSIDEIMGLAHRTLPLHGVQFHPEAILTEQGHQLLANFLTLAALAQPAAVDS